MDYKTVFGLADLTNKYNPKILSVLKVYCSENKTLNAVVLLMSLICPVSVIS